MIGTLIIGISLLAFASSLYFATRNERVCLFREMLSDMAYEYQMRHIYDSRKNAFQWFCNKHSYGEMLYSFKPLKLEYWFTEIELYEINS